MTIRHRYFQTTRGAFLFLDELACGTSETYVFRGHSKVGYTLINTWQRHRQVPHEFWMTDIEDTLTRYKVGLQKLGIASQNHEDRFEALEHGRNHGVPTPCLDFSYSPYVALFFAFNDVQGRPGLKNRSYSVIYALNVNRLADFWARRFCPEQEYRQAYDAFLHPDTSLFARGYPDNHLQFIPLPGRSNSRMQRQLGTFLYDTLDYDRYGVKGLEELLASIHEEEGGAETPTLYKLFINQECAGTVFQRLELMNMTGGYLYGDAGGVALDIRNSYNYHPKSFYMRDLHLPNINGGSTS